jgi:hypothetical protein
MTSCALFCSYYGLKNRNLACIPKNTYYSHLCTLLIRNMKEQDNALPCPECTPYERDARPPRRWMEKTATRCCVGHSASPADPHCTYRVCENCRGSGTRRIVRRARRTMNPTNQQRDLNLKRRRGQRNGRRACSSSTSSGSRSRVIISSRSRRGVYVYRNTRTSSH